jgi:hypothetical protein
MNAGGQPHSSEKMPCKIRILSLRYGGEGGIRTPDTVARMPHFECGAFNHSATSPTLNLLHKSAFAYRGKGRLLPFCYPIVFGAFVYYVLQIAVIARRSVFLHSGHMTCEYKSIVIPTFECLAFALARGDWCVKSE